MKHFAIVALLCLLASCGGGGSDAPSIPPSCASTALIFGDSITAGAGVCEGYPNCTMGTETSGDMVGRLAGIPITNLATGGETSTTAINGPATLYKDFFTYIDNSNAKMIIIRYGAADSAFVRDSQKTYSNITRMVEYAKQKEKIVVLVGVTQLTNQILNYFPSDIIQIATSNNSVVEQVASEQGVRFVDVRSIPYTDSDVYDGIHPYVGYSDKQSHLIADSIKPLVCK